MYDGMNPEETLEVGKIRDLCVKLSYTQTYSLAKSLLEDLHRGIYYLGKERDEFKEENERLKKQLYENRITPYMNVVASLDINYDDINSDEYNCNDCEYDDEDKLHEKCEDCLKHSKLVKGTKDNFKLCKELRDKDDQTKLPKIPEFVKSIDETIILIKKCKFNVGFGYLVDIPSKGIHEFCSKQTITDYLSVIIKFLEDEF